MRKNAQIFLRGAVQSPLGFLVYCAYMRPLFPKSAQQKMPLNAHKKSPDCSELLLVFSMTAKLVCQSFEKGGSFDFERVGQCVVKLGL